MSFTVEDFHDLIRLLETHPEWRTDLRRLLLSEEFLALPEQLAALRVRSEEQFQALIEADQRLERRLDTLAERLDTLTVQVSSITAQMQDITTDLGEVKGYSLEAAYRDKGPAYFGWMVRRPHVLTADELVTLIEDGVETGRFSQAEVRDLYAADVVVRGRLPDEDTHVYLIVEVSWGVGTHDVERAAHRAAVFARLGTRTLPVVAGKWINPDAARLARLSHVWQLINGRPTAPETLAC